MARGRNSESLAKLALKVLKGNKGKGGQLWPNVVGLEGQPDQFGFILEAEKTETVKIREEPAIRLV